MKKVIFIVLSIMLLAMFTACGCSTDANVEGNMDGNSGQVTDSGKNGSNEGVAGGSASAEFEAGIGDNTRSANGGNSGNGGNGGNSNSGMTNGNGSRTNTSANDKGELSKLASLIGADDFKVIDTLGEGNPDTVINGNIAIVKRRTYSLPIFGNQENVILSYGKNGLIENIEISPDYAPTLWSTNISGEYGIADKVSSNGLDYDYYSVWRNDKEKIELICWNNKMSVQITEA